MNVNIETVVGIENPPSEQSCGIALINRALSLANAVVILAANVNVSGVGLHRECTDDRSFDEQMRALLHHGAIAESARFALIGVHANVMRPLFLFRKKAPLH